MEGFFADAQAVSTADSDRIVYEVDRHQPAAEGTEGALYFGITHIHPGDIGGEFHMTKGHFHANGSRAEYYWGIHGRGVLLLMSRDGETRAEEVRPGSLHYIPGDLGHRLVNTGDTSLDVGACWPADAGYDYGSIAERGFGLRVMRGPDGPRLLAVQR